MMQGSSRPPVTLVEYEEARFTPRGQHANIVDCVDVIVVEGVGTISYVQASRLVDPVHVCLGKSIPGEEDIVRSGRVVVKVKSTQPGSDAVVSGVKSTLHFRDPHRPVGEGGRVDINSKLVFTNTTEVGEVSCCKARTEPRLPANRPPSTSVIPLYFTEDAVVTRPSNGIVPPIPDVRRQVAVAWILVGVQCIPFDMVRPTSESSLDSTLELGGC